MNLLSVDKAKSSKLRFGIALFDYLTMKQRNSNIHKCSKVANDSAWKWSQYSSNIHAEVKYHTNLVEIDMKQQIS